VLKERPIFAAFVRHSFSSLLKVRIFGRESFWEKRPLLHAAEDYPWKTGDSPGIMGVFLWERGFLPRKKCVSPSIREGHPQKNPLFLRENFPFPRQALLFLWTKVLYFKRVSRFL